MSSDTIDLVQLKAAIAKDLALVELEAGRLEEMARKARAVASASQVRLAKGESVGSLVTISAADLDMQASRVARRIDHMMALIEVAFLVEGGGL